MIKEFVNGCELRKANNFPLVTNNTSIIQRIIKLHVLNHMQTLSKVELSEQRQF